MFWKKAIRFSFFAMSVFVFGGSHGVLSSDARKARGKNVLEKIATNHNEVVSVASGIENDQRVLPQTGMTRAVPLIYLTPMDHHGTVARIEYNSKDYARDKSDIIKEAYVYTPYGYDKNDLNTKYNIIYLMHGMGGRAGEYFKLEKIRNMFDHLIGNRDIPPSIIVSATFYNKNSETDFQGSIRELRVFHKDFVNNLMPAVEEQFHTYAVSTSAEDLAASRGHRAFGGFSLGSVTTWMEFCYDYDYIRYFLPMSGSSWYYGSYGNYYPVKTADFFEDLIKKNSLKKRGYFIYATTGTQDVVRDQVEIQMQEMLKRRKAFPPDHVVYYQKQNGRHNFEAVQEYLFNALPLFF
ncbi:hypothetical protein [uncultured Cohaesibacter sp.]|uniref:alpha/beta hydrolase n=1 Tax=uncultured Cohaesibacter sp. TaxID=1002546 RepID=UPI00293142E3|nr:hypothetical protein [uncultured Cohaesibacter sp.]